MSNRSDYIAPPLEKKLNASFLGKKVVIPTKYAETNANEWFAESYSLYRMGRPDLIDPDLLNLTHDIETGAYP